MRDMKDDRDFFVKFKVETPTDSYIKKELFHYQTDMRERVNFLSCLGFDVTDYGKISERKIV